MSYQTVVPYRSRSSSPASLSQNIFTTGEALHSPSTSSPLAYSCPVEEEGIFPTQMSCPDDFLPPPWDPVAYGQSMTKSMTRGSRRQRIPRPPNAFMLFRSFLLKYRLIERMANHQQNASRVAGLIWRDSALPNRVRLAWHQRADVIRDWHKETFPDYTYTPTRRRLTKVEEDSDEEVDVETRKKHVKRHLGSTGAASLPARRHRHLKTVEHESDSDEECSSCKRRAQHRTPQHPVSLASSRSSRRTARLEPSASSHPATSRFHPTPQPGASVAGRRASYAKHIFNLLDMQSYISTELSLAYARMSDTGAASSSPVPTPLPAERFLAPSPLMLSSIPLYHYVPEYDAAQTADVGVPVPAPSLSSQTFGLNSVPYNGCSSIPGPGVLTNDILDPGNATFGPTATYDQKPVESFIHTETMYTGTCDKDTENLFDISSQAAFGPSHTINSLTTGSFSNIEDLMAYIDSAWFENEGVTPENTS